jgi:hypothetical protein
MTTGVAVLTGAVAVAVSLLLFGHGAADDPYAQRAEGIDRGCRRRVPPRARDRARAASPRPSRRAGFLSPLIDARAGSSSK